MKNTLRIYYDGEGDLLEVILGKPTSGYFDMLDDGVFQRLDEKTKETRGFSILSLKKRIEDSMSLDIPFSADLVLDKRVVMKSDGQIHIHYDVESDLLEIGTTDCSKGSLVDLGNGIFERTDGAGNILGFAIFSFEKRTQHFKPINVPIQRKRKILA